MLKAKAVRIAGFVGALGASALLVGFAVNGTGAYFSDSHDGHLVGTSGHLKVDTSGQNIDFNGLMPGVDQSQNITFTPTAGSANEDIWITFDTTSAAYTAFTGARTSPGGGGLGGYGHFKVVGAAAANSFESYNLQVASPGETSCPIDANGNGGSPAKATGPNNGSDAANECGVPGAILIAHDVAAGVSHSATVTFGLTGKAQGQDTTWVSVPFKVVATQVGIRPGAANF